MFYQKIWLECVQILTSTIHVVKRCAYREYLVTRFKLYIYSEIQVQTNLPFLPNFPNGLSNSGNLNSILIFLKFNFSSWHATVGLF